MKLNLTAVVATVILAAPALASSEAINKTITACMFDEACNMRIELMFPTVNEIADCSSLVYTLQISQLFDKDEHAEFLWVMTNLSVAAYYRRGISDEQQLIENDAAVRRMTDRAYFERAEELCLMKSRAVYGAWNAP